MVRPKYISMLSPQERAASIKFGAALAFGLNGIPLSRADEVVKQALPSAMGAVDGAMKAILATSVIAGVPMGIAAHMVGKQVSANRQAERERLARIKYYRDVTRSLEGGLAGVPEKKIQQ